MKSTLHPGFSGYLVLRWRASERASTDGPSIVGAYRWQHEVPNLTPGAHQTFREAERSLAGSQGVGWR